MLHRVPQHHRDWWNHWTIGPSMIAPDKSPFWVMSHLLKMKTYTVVKNDTHHIKNLKQWTDCLAIGYVDLIYNLSYNLYMNNLSRLSIVFSLNPWHLAHGLNPPRYRNRQVAWCPPWSTPSSLSSDVAWCRWDRWTTSCRPNSLCPPHPHPAWKRANRNGL
jgi:hypothetical protein